jgi:hypothetical protein
MSRLLSKEKRDEVIALLLQGLTPHQIAPVAKVTKGVGYYLREKLYAEGRLRRKAPAPGLQRQNAGSRVRPSRAGQDSAPGFGVALCLVDGCHTRARIGNFCEVHETANMIARATAGMSEATRKKLTGGRA